MANGTHQDARKLGAPLRATTPAAVGSIGPFTIAQLASGEWRISSLSWQQLAFSAQYIGLRLVRKCPTENIILRLLDEPEFLHSQGQTEKSLAKVFLVRVDPDSGHFDGLTVLKISAQLPVSFLSQQVLSRSAGMNGGVPAHDQAISVVDKLARCAEAYLFATGIQTKGRSKSALQGSRPL
jgi:hypothetical protein